ncbi:MAG: sodium ion-translocating decarboxylase subunit beta [Desulfosalsimonas sp.]
MLFGFLETGFLYFYWGNALMILIGCVLIFLGIAKKMEPLLLIPIGFSIILVNLPLGGLMDYKYELKAQQPGIVEQIVIDEASRFGEGAEIIRTDSETLSSPVHGRVKKLQVKPGQKVEAGDVTAVIITTMQTDQSAIPTQPQGLLSRLFAFGIMWHILPPLIFLSLGALTNFGPMLANPLTMLLGAASQFGVYFAFFISLFFGFSFEEAASIGIIGGAEGPTTIFVTASLAPHIIGATAVACYSYMALVPLILPPVVRLLTTKNERQIYMKPRLRAVSKLEKILFPIVAAIIVILLVPSSAPLIGCFMVGNLFRECGVVERLSETAQTSFVDILTIFITLTIGGTMAAENFITVSTLSILVIGVFSFASAAAAGIIFAKIMNLFCKEKINPMLGAAGVSAVPMAARVVHVMGQKENRKNYLLMHAMGPNVAGAIGAAIAGGIFVGVLG